MSSIQEKMESLRLQKASYGATRKVQSKSLVSKHPTLPRTTTKTNHYQPKTQVSLFSNPKKTLNHVHPPADNSYLYSPIQQQHKTNATESEPVKSSLIFKKNNNASSSNDVKPKPIISGVDPMQNCYGSRRDRMSQLNTNELDDKPKGILSQTSSPVGTPGSRKRVTFNLEDRPSSASYAPPSATPSGLSSTGIGYRGTPSNSGGRPIRPSLSEQLSAIAGKASDVTADIKAKAGLDKDKRAEKPLLTSPAKNFTVGHLQCRYAAPVEFFEDRFEYKFHHPFQNTEIHLTIYYRDMINASLPTTPVPGKLIFRVPRHLVHFAADYDPSKHFVVLFLSSSMDVAFIRKNIMPKLK